jgi:hypothetical protein
MNPTALLVRLAEHISRKSHAQGRADHSRPLPLLYWRQRQDRDGYECSQAEYCEMLMASSLWSMRHQTVSRIIWYQQCYTT